MDDDGNARRPAADAAGAYFVTLGDEGAGPPPRRDPAPPPPPRRAWPAVVLAVALTIGAIVFAVRGPDAEPAPPVATATDLPLLEHGFAVWSRNPDGSPVRWNPCEPIRWVFNPSGAPDGAQRDLEAAVASVSEQTGIPFLFAGTTDEPLSRDRSPYVPERYGRDTWAPVLVGWVAPAESDVPLGPNDRAVSIPVAIDDGERSIYVSGQIAFNLDRQLRPGFADRETTWGATAMHEFGHLVGLDHVSDPRQLMYPHPSNGPVRWGQGDVAGLRVLGAAAGCLTTPEPHPVRVDYRD